MCVRFRECVWKEQTKVAVSAASIVKWNNKAEKENKKHQEGTEMGHSREIQIDLCTTHFIQKKTYESGCSRHCYKVSVCVFVYVGAFVTQCVCVRVNARGMLSMYHVSHSICTYVWMHVCVCVVLWNAQLKQIWILILFKYLIPIWLKPDCRKWRSVSLPLSHSPLLRPLPQYGFV